MHSLLLHEENLLRVPLVGVRMARDLEKRAQEVKEYVAAHLTETSAGVTVLIRTKNDSDNIGHLLDDIRANQEFFTGSLQVVLVDTESTDGTPEIARRYQKFFEVTVVNIKQSEFDYAKSLNMGFEAAKQPLVMTLVGHSLLAHKMTLAAASLYADRSDFIGGFCYTMPNANASIWELLGFGYGRPAMMIHRPAELLQKPIMGMLGGNCSLIRREIWEKLDGYDLAYGAGGEDSELGRRAWEAGYKIMVDPGLTVYHSHGLGFMDNARQFLYWNKLDKPVPFEASELAKFRNDLGLEDSAPAKKR